MTPDDYRKNPTTLNRMTKPELLLHYLLIDEGVPLITDGIVLEINRPLLKEPICFIGMKVDMPVQFADGRILCRAICKPFFGNYKYGALAESN